MNNEETQSGRNVPGKIHHICKYNGALWEEVCDGASSLRCEAVPFVQTNCSWLLVLVIMSCFGTKRNEAFPDRIWKQGCHNGVCLSKEEEQIVVNV